MSANTRRRWSLPFVNGLRLKAADETLRIGTSTIRLTAYVSDISLCRIHLKSHFVAPTHACCNNCDGTAINGDTNADFVSQPERPSTPISAHPFPGSAQASPSKSADANGKRKMVIPKPPSWRLGTHLENANLILENWRFKTVRTKYTPGPFTFASFLPDTVLKTLASQSSIQSVANMETSVKWIFTYKHGDEILGVLRDFDKSERQEHEAAVLKRREDRKAATAAKCEAEKQVKDLEREQKKREKEAKCLVEEEAKWRKAAERANAKVLAAAVAKPPAKRT